MADKKRIDVLHIFIEIGVITIGIVIAYQLNNWNENRKLKQSEINILKEIKSNLELDLIDMSNNQFGHEDGLKSIDSLNKWASEGEYTAKIPYHIFNVFRDFLFIPQTSAFETLKARGVDLISNDSLRIRILRLYDFQYAAVIQLERDYAPGQFHDDFEDIVNAYFLSFDIQNPETIRPKFNHSRWINNADVKTKLDLVRNERGFYNNSYLELMSEVNSLISAIENELED